MGARVQRHGRVRPAPAPIVIGRDHLDCGSVASPYRETEAMADGSDAIADWPLLNAMVNVASGASWVSIHDGGGVGIGRSLHAGQVTVADGTTAGGGQARTGPHQRPGHGRHAPRGRRLPRSQRHRGPGPAAPPVTTWWAEHAWLGGPRTAANVLISEKEGRLTAVSSDTPPPPDAIRLRGLALPGLANGHSHAFHRTLRGRTHEHAGSFWTWRRPMYDVAARLDPDTYGRLARAVFAEMTLAGFTAVGEFHYLHHGPDGRPYDDPNAMGLAVIDAAHDAGIRLTLLDTRYVSAGEPAQRRFSGHRLGQPGRSLAHRRHHPPRRRHPLGACRPPEAAEEVAACAADAIGPSTPTSPNNAAEHDGYAPTPLNVLADAGALSPRFTAVHGTHLSSR